MARGTKFKPEEIIAKLREAEVELARGKKVPEACKQIGVTEQTTEFLDELRLISLYFTKTCAHLR